MPHSSSGSSGDGLSAALPGGPVAAQHVIQEAFLQAQAIPRETDNDRYLPAARPANGQETADRRAIQKALREERKRIARDIHDYAEQLIVAVLLRLARLEQNPADAKSQCDEVRRTLTALNDSLRRISGGLRMASICNGTLPITLSRIAERWTTDTGIAIALHLEPVEFRDPDARISATVARVVQLMLNNVAKHAASATRVDLHLKRLETAVAVTVEDNGPGFSAADGTSEGNQRARSGLIYMQEHLAEVGGHLIVDSIVGSGTKAIAVIPAGGCS
jgi:signal transduction histidine kinase